MITANLLKNTLLLMSLVLFLAIACTPNRILSKAYNTNSISRSEQGLVYYLPKKILVLELTFDFYHKVKVRKYEKNAKPEEYALLETYAILKNIKVDDTQTVPDMTQAVLLTFTNPRTLSSNLNATFNFKNGMLTSVKTNSKDQSGEVFSSLFNTGLSLARFGNPIASLISGTRGEETSAGPSYREELAIDTQSNVVIRHIVEPQPTTLKRTDYGFDLSEVLGEDINHFDTRINITLNNGQPIADYSNSNPLLKDSRSYEGIVYRNPLPVRTTVSVESGKTGALSIAREAVPTQVVSDGYVYYSQFGTYGVAQFDMNKGRDSEISMTFDAENNTGLVLYSYDVKESRTRKLKALAQSVQNTDTTINYLKYGRRREAMQREIQMMQSETTMQQALLEFEKMKLAQEKAALELEKEKAAFEEEKRKLEEERRKTGN